MAMIQCKSCNSTVNDADPFCPNCGAPTAQQTVHQQPVYTQPVYVQPAAPQSKVNGCGIAGFVLGLISLVFCWWPHLAWLSIPGLVLSIVGMCLKDRSKSFAIAGLVCSIIALLIWVIALIVVSSAVASWVSYGLF